MKLSFLISTAVAVVAVASSLEGVASPRTPGAAFYTAAQATAGQKAYDQNCSSCHGVKLEGVKAPALAGEGMAGSQSVADIYGFMVQQMPAGAPGSLTSAQYTSIMAYVLKKNGHPAGKTPLTSASVKKITAKI